MINCNITELCVNLRRASLTKPLMHGYNFLPLKHEDPELLY